MSDLDDVVVALKNRLITGMGSDPISQRFWAWAPDSLDPPCGIVLPAPGDFLTFDVTFSHNAQDRILLLVKLLMGSQDDRTWQAALLGYLSRTGTNSIYTAIYGDETLGGVVSDVTGVAVSNYGDVEWAAQTFYGADISVEVLT